MKLRDNKGSITIFVLVGLLFMSSFLLLSYGSNVNKSKTAKEMFNMVRSTYSYNDGDENAYMRAYTVLRKQNAQEITSSSENSSTLELTKTFYGPISNYKIYGNSIQDTTTYGTPSLDNPVKIQSVGHKIDENLFPTAIDEFYSFSSDKAEIQEDGWISFNFDNTSGTGWGYINLWPKKDDTIVNNKDYTFILETKEITGVKEITFSQNRTDISSQFNMNFSVNISDNSQYFKSVTANNAEKGKYLSRTFLTIPAGSNASGKIRISIVEGTVTSENFKGYNSYVKYKIPVKVSGKNLVNVPDMNIQFTGYYNNYFPDNPKLLLEPNTQYTVSFNYVINSTTARVECGIGYGTSYYAVDMAYGADYPNQTQGRFEYTFTTPTGFSSSQTPYLQFRFVRAETSGTFDVDISNVQVELGNKATEYEQYVEPQTVDIYLDEPLRKVGNVADYIDFSTGKVVRQVRNLSLNITDMNNSEGYPGWTNIEKLKQDYPDKNTYLANVTKMLCNITNAYNFIGINTNGNGTVFFYQTQLNLSQTDIKAAYPDLNVNIMYALATPDEPEIISIPELKSYEDYTKIEVLTEIAPSKIEAIYDGYTFEK